MMTDKFVGQDSFDFVELPKIKKTPDGFLTGNAIVTKTGVFKYKTWSGKVMYQLRHPDDVFADKSLHSLRLIPVTLDHPDEIVTIDNAESLQVGSTGDEVLVKGDKVICSLSIFKKNAVQAIKRGKKQLSLGYRHNLVEEAGEYEGQKYTHRQINICYNHLAIVDAGRVGPDARLNLDSVSVMINEENEGKIMNEKENQDSDEKVEIQDQNENSSKDTENKNNDCFKQKIDELAKSLESKQECLQSLNKEVLSSKEELKQLKEEYLKKVEDFAKDSKKNDLLFDKKLKLIDQASQFVSRDSLYSKSIREIHELVLKNSNKNFACDGKSDEYVAGVFDTFLQNKQEQKSRETLKKQYSFSEDTNIKKPLSFEEIYIEKRRKI